MSWIMIMLVLSAAVLFWIGVAILAAFVVQLAILSLTERRLRLLRCAPLAVPAQLLRYAGLTGSVLGLGGGGALLLGWGLGWALYKFQKRRESHEKTDPDL